MATADPKRKRLNDAERRARDRLILEARSHGQTWPQIASRFSLSVSAARRAAANAAKLMAEQGLADLDPGNLLEQIVRAEARALYRLEELVHDSNAAVAVGAARAIGTVGADLRTSLTAAGLLPGSGDELWLRRQMREAAGAMLDAAEEVGGKPMMDALERRLDANARTAGLTQ